MGFCRVFAASGDFVGFLLVFVVLFCFLLVFAAFGDVFFAKSGVFTYKPAQKRSCLKLYRKDLSLTLGTF